jgi:tetratricopeptide (TPR) repeat protein
MVMMVIGFSSRNTTLYAKAGLIVLTALCLTLRGVAEDQIVKNNGETFSGRITGVANGGVMIETKNAAGGVAKFPVFLADIKSVAMATPPDVARVQAAETPPADVITALEAPVKQFAGVPVGWVVDAMSQLGDAYARAGQTAKALAVYNEIGTLYPGTAYVHIADASKAELSLEAGKVDEAMKIVQPLVEQANQNIAPSPVDGASYAKAFIVYGRGLVAQQKLPEALEAFLTVKTMFYQNPALVAEAERYAKDLRDKNKDLGVE